MDFEKGTASEDGKIVRVRLRLAQAFINMLLTAYDALLAHGVNYRNLPAYKDERLLDEARELPLERGHDSFMAWLARIHNDIKAAVRRKGFHEV